MARNKQVFLSYSSVDAALVRRLAVDLISLGADVWLDQLSLGVGERILEEIQTAVDRTDLMLVFVSQHSLASGWVQLEWQRLGVAGGNVLPVRLERCEMPDELASQAYVDIAGGAYWNGIAQIAHRIGLEDVRPAIMEVPEVLPISTLLKIDLGAQLTSAFEGMGEVNGPEQWALSKMRERIRAQFGVPCPGVRFVGDVSGLRPRVCVLSVEDVPIEYFDVEEDVSILDTVLARLEPTIIANLDRFIDPDLCAQLFDQPFLTGSEHVRATPGELTAIFREAARQGLDLNRVSALDTVLPARRDHPIDPIYIVEDIRPFQAERLSRQAATTGAIQALTLDPNLEAFAEAHLERAVFTTITIDPDWIDNVWQAIRAKSEETGATTLIVETPILRRTFERLQMAELTTLARRDLHPDVPVRHLGVVSIDGGAV